MQDNFTQYLADEQATLEAADAFASHLRAGCTIYLHGDLGAGKTTFVRGVLQVLGHISKVKSPTYNLVESYCLGGVQIYHFDLYRFADEGEWDALGFSEYFNVDSICFVEWPEKAGDCLPKPDVEIYLEVVSIGRVLRVFFRQNSHVE